MTPRLFALISTLAAALAQAQTASCPANTTWPAAEWDASLVETTAQTRATEIAALEAELFTLVGTDAERKGLRTDGLVIIKGGKLIYEKYARGFGPQNRHISWSVAKSYSSVMTGVAVRQGALTLEDSICDHLTEYQGQAVCDIKVKHPLTFTSGLAWQEGYENESYQYSSVISMLFGAGRRDQLKHILTHARAGEPGAHWLYSTGDSELQATVVKRALEAKGHGKDAFWTLLFDKIGAPSTILEEDLHGAPQGGSSLWATPRDFARLGYLMINDGCWNGERLLPEGWVAASTTTSQGFIAGGDHDNTTPSGYSWWLNRAVPERGLELPWKDVPADAYAALGHWGQFILVVPSLDVVVVRTGDDRRAGLHTNTLGKLALGVAR